MKKSLFILLLFFFMFTITGCGAKSEGGLAEDYVNSEISNLFIETTRKIYYTGRIDIVGKNIEEVSGRIGEKVKGYNGYISSSSYRDNDETINIVVEYRIPTENLDKFLDDVDQEKGVTSKSISSTDITTSYNKASARLQVLKASREAYLNALASTSVIHEIISINDKLVDIDSEILELETRLSEYDNLLDYSTITISYSTKAKDNFLIDYLEYLGNFFIVLFKVILYVLPVAFVGGLIAFIIILIDKKNKKKRLEKTKDIK